MAGIMGLITAGVVSLITVVAAVLDIVLVPTELIAETR